MSFLSKSEALDVVAYLEKKYAGRLICYIKPVSLWVWWRDFCVTVKGEPLNSAERETIREDVISFIQEKSNKTLSFDGLIFHSSGFYDSSQYLFGLERGIVHSAWNNVEETACRNKLVQKGVTRKNIKTD